MCGIAGLIARAGETVSGEQIRRMTDTIVHRGPDDDGFHVRGSVGLGMRRLSIIDLSGGSQPIYNEDRSMAVVFNGEIYNFPELRLELESRGHQFRTHSDTEVIVHLYEEMGADCVKRLRGMFAIALYDEKRQTLLLARDRLGKKPLYYAQRAGRLYFGSEIKALLAAAPELAEADPDGVLQFFYYGYVPDPLSAFRDIRKLPPGHLAEWRNGQIHTRQYWDVPAYGGNDPEPDKSYSDEACLEEMERRLADAVRVRLISDVPLGAMLSGGVDSSVVVALMARESSAPVKTFSIGFRRADFNEAEQARLVAERFGTDHHELVLEPDIVETVNHLTGMMEEPFGDSSMIPTYCVSQLARRHVTVALSGDGGDELFAGYDRYAVNLKRRRFEIIPGWVGNVYRNHVYPQLASGVKGRKLAWNITLPSRDRYLDDISFLPVLGRERNLFSDDFVAHANRAGNPFKQFQRYYDDAPATDHLSRLMYLDTKTYLAGDILTKVDRMSMATSLEVRCPILDHLFVEWVASLPVKYKLRDGKRKFLFRKLAERVGVPTEVLNRRKSGFALPLVHWMRHELKGQLEMLEEPRTIQRGYFKKESVRVVLDEHFRGRRDHSGVLWMMLMFELWHRNFLEKMTRGSLSEMATCAAELTPSSSIPHTATAAARLGDAAR
jgi:asparagine synthase (glutamine-hydrolysing)